MRSVYVVFGLLAAKSLFSTVPTEFWIWGTVTLLMTAALGFAAGFCYARTSVKRALKRAQKHVSKLFAVVMESLEQAQEACALLEKFPGLQLSAKQTDKLNGKRGRLLDVVGNIVEGQTERIATEVKKKQEDAQVAKAELVSGWSREPVDMTTGIPDRTAFDTNLETMLAIGTQGEMESGLLLVKIDKFDQLKARFNASGAERFLKTMSSIICRALRDDDLVCRYSADTFGVLFPGVDAETGRRLSLAIRNSVRNYHFRVEECGPEILVTASFGYTRCLPHDNFDLVLNRAGNALSRSSKKGRNQLHVHDGAELSHCRAG